MAARDVSQTGKGIVEQALEFGNGIDDPHAAADLVMEKVSNLRNTLNNAMGEKYGDFGATVAKAESLQNDVVAAYDVVQAAVEQSKAPESFLFSEAELGVNKDVADQLLRTKRVVEVLKLLSKINDSFLKFDEALRDGKVELTAKLLLETASAVGVRADSVAPANVEIKSLSDCIIPSESKVFRLVQHQFFKKKQVLNEYLQGAFHQAVRFSDGQGGDSSLVIRKRIVDMYGNAVDLSSIMSAIQDVEESYAIVGDFCTSLLGKVFAPLLTNLESNVKLQRTEDEVKITVSQSGRKLQGKDARGLVSNALDYTNAVLEFIAKFLFYGSGEVEETLRPTMLTFGEKLWGEKGQLGEAGAETSSGICTLLISVLDRCLHSQALITGAEIKEITKLVNGFEQTVSKLGLIEVNAEGSELVHHVKNMDKMAAKEQHTNLLSKARTILLAGYQDAVVVDENNDCDSTFSTTENNTAELQREMADFAVDSESEELDGQFVAFALERMAITVCTKQLVRLAHGALQDMERGSEEFCRAVWQGVWDMFDLYCAIIPSFYGQNIGSIPGLAMLHHNDCLYISHHLMLFGHMYGPFLPQDMAGASMIGLTPTFRSMATTVFVQQLQDQHEEICTLLSALIGGGGNYGGTGPVLASLSSDGAETAKKGAALHISRLFRLWSKVLGRATLKQALGLLISRIPLAVFHDVTGYIRDEKEAHAFQHCRKRICGDL
jgi:hypothetical protein